MERAGIPSPSILDGKSPSEIERSLKDFRSSTIRLHLKSSISSSRKLHSAVTLLCRLGKDSREFSSLKMLFPRLALRYIWRNGQVRQ